MDSIDIPLVFQFGAKKPTHGAVNRGETVNWVSDRIRVRFTGFQPAKGEPVDPDFNMNPFGEKEPRQINNIVSKNAPAGVYQYEVFFDDTLVGEGTIPIPREPPNPT
jgi:hypothetical protein